MKDYLPYQSRFIVHRAPGSQREGVDKCVVAGTVLAPLVRFKHEGEDLVEVWQGHVILIPDHRIFVPHDAHVGTRIDQKLVSAWFNNPGILCEVEP